LFHFIGSRVVERNRVLSSCGSTAFERVLRPTTSASFVSSVGAALAFRAVAVHVEFVEFVKVPF
jgi:hypothetical protein